MEKWAHLGSNQGPTGYEPVALPTELWARIVLRYTILNKVDGPTLELDLRFTSLTFIKMRWGGFTDPLLSSTKSMLGNVYSDRLTTPTMGFCQANEYHAGTGSAIDKAF
jgi:hypothetical protein